MRKKTFSTNGALIKFDKGKSEVLSFNSHSMLYKCSDNFFNKQQSH